MGTFGSSIDFSAIKDSMGGVLAGWLNGHIQIIDPNTSEATWNPYTNTETGGEPTIIWSGPARIHPIRSKNTMTVDYGYSETAIHGVRFMVPVDRAAGFIRKGLQVIVTNGGNDYELEQLQFTIISAINSSHTWFRTIEARVDVKSIANSTWSGISGNVINSLAAPVSGATVRTFHLEGGLWISDYETVTDVYGNYQLPADAGVPVVVGVVKSAYVTQFYSNKASQGTGQLVTPVNHVETQSINFILASL